MLIKDIDIMNELVTVVLTFNEVLELSGKVPSTSLKTGAFELIEFGNFLSSRDINRREEIGE